MTTEPVKFTAKITDLKAKASADPGISPQGTVNLAGGLTSQIAAALWDMADGHPVQVTIERMQDRLPASQPPLAGPEQEAPCAHCGMMKGHADDCPITEAMRGGGGPSVPKAFHSAFEKPAKAPKLRARRKKDGPMLCQECERPVDDHTFGCATGERRQMDSFADGRCMECDTKNGHAIWCSKGGIEKL